MLLGRRVHGPRWLEIAALHTRAALPGSIVLGMLVLALGTGSVGAQTSSAAQLSNPTAAGLQEVVVSATRRLEDIQDVPLSLTAFSAAQLQAKGVESFF